MRGSRLRRRPSWGAVLVLWAGVCAGAADEGAAVGGVAPGYAELAFAAPVPGTYALPPLYRAADGIVLDESGAQTSLHQIFGGKNTLLAFVYSNCSDVNGCPLAAHVFYRLKVAMQSDPLLAQGLQLVSLSFDPTRDTPEVMSLYGKNFDYAGAAGDWRFLTTASEAALAPILRDYGQELQREMSVAADADVEYSHLLRVFLIDSDKRVRNIYGVSFLHHELLIADARTLMLEPQRPSAAYAVEAETQTVAHSAASRRASRITQPPLGLPMAAIQHDEAEITLGRRLFFDRRLSHNGTFSCAMCHVPSQGFSSNELTTSVGLEGRSVRRNAPSLYNIGYAQRLFHDGRDTRLEEQIWSPLLAHNEMANPSVGFVLQTLRALPVYQQAFRRAYGQPATMQNLGRALAAYQRSLNAADSPFDRWRFGRESDAVDDSVKRGFRLFSGKAQCASCHLVGEDSALFSDWKLHNTGVGYLKSMGVRPSTQRVQAAPGVYLEVPMHIIDSVAEAPAADLGFYEISQDPADRWKYRTPSLRNVELSWPYMHDGSLGSLGEVIEFYNRGGVPNENLSPLIRPLQLNALEAADLEAFLRSLTGSTVGAIVDDALAAPVGDPGGDGREGASLGRSGEYQP